MQIINKPILCSLDENRIHYEITCSLLVESYVNTTLNGVCKKKRDTASQEPQMNTHTHNSSEMLQESDKGKRHGGAKVCA